MDVLTRRQLNRATLDRQLLLARQRRPALDAIEHLVGMQAQEPRNPYVALWSRLDDFDPAELEQLVLDRAVVRIVCMRGTVHLVTAGDALVLRPLSQPVLDGELRRHSQFKDALAGRDLSPAVAFTERLLADTGPVAGPRLRAAMADRFPELDSAAVAWAMRNMLPMVQVPPRGLWYRSGQVATTTVDLWLGRPVETEPDLDAVVLRYLRAFGPATVADVATWSRLTALRPVLDRLRPQLRTYRDERGRELFDVPGVELPDTDTPAPARFLPEYDNVLLSHADRARFHAADPPPSALWQQPRALGTVLHDGVVVGPWHLDGDDLVILHGAPLPKRARADIAAEGERLLGFLDAEPAAEVRFRAPEGAG